MKFVKISMKLCMKMSVLYFERDDFLVMELESYVE